MGYVVLGSAEVGKEGGRREEARCRANGRIQPSKDTPFTSNLTAMPRCQSSAESHQAGPTMLSQGASHRNLGRPLRRRRSMLHDGCWAKQAPHVPHKSSGATRRSGRARIDRHAQPNAPTTPNLVKLRPSGAHVRADVRATSASDLCQAPCKAPPRHTHQRLGIGRAACRPQGPRWSLCMPDVYVPSGLRRSVLGRWRCHLGHKCPEENLAPR